MALSLTDANDYGFNVTLGGSDWPTLKRKRDVSSVLRLQTASTSAIYFAKGVAYVRGTARFLDKSTVEVNGGRMTARHIVIATGGKPSVPTLTGSEHGITSDGFFSLEQRPKRVAIVGSGYVARGSWPEETFHELGARVEIFIRKDHLLMSFDAMLGKSLMREMRDQGIIVFTTTSTCRHRFERTFRPQDLVGGGRPRFTGLRLPVGAAIGRAANVSGLDLRKAGVALDDCNFVVTDGFQNTNVQGHCTRSAM